MKRDEKNNFFQSLRTAINRSSHILLRVSKCRTANALDKIMSIAQALIYAGKIAVMWLPIAHPLLLWIVLLSWSPTLPQNLQFIPWLIFVADITLVMYGGFTVAYILKQKGITP